MVLDPAPKPGGVSVADVALAPRIGNRLLQQICSAAGLEQVSNSSADCCDRNAFLNCDVIGGEIAPVHDNALWRLPTQPNCTGNDEMDRCRIGIGNRVDCKCGRV